MGNDPIKKEVWKWDEIAGTVVVDMAEVKTGVDDPVMTNHSVTETTVAAEAAKAQSVVATERTTTRTAEEGEGVTAAAAAMTTESLS